MSVVFNIILPILVVLSILAIIYFIARAFAARSRAGSQPYNVGRLVVRQSAQVNLFRALVALLFALFFLALIAIGPASCGSYPGAHAHAAADGRSTHAHSHRTSDADADLRTGGYAHIARADGYPAA